MTLARLGLVSLTGVIRRSGVRTTFEASICQWRPRGTPCHQPAKPVVALHPESRVMLDGHYGPSDHRRPRYRCYLGGVGRQAR